MRLKTPDRRAVTHPKVRTWHREPLKPLSLSDLNAPRGINLDPAD